MRKYILSVLLLMILSYSVYFFFNEDIVAELGSEDGLFEWLTALAFLIVSVLSLLTFAFKKKAFYLIFAIVFFFGFAEEISWGQRIFGFETPEIIGDRNVQSEFNIHNIEILNTEYHDGQRKKGLSRLLEINFLFKVFTILFGIFLPLLVFHFRLHDIRSFRKLRIPVPPVTLGVFFFVNWIVFRALLNYLLPEGNQFQYYDTDTEIFEFIASAILLAMSIYFYRKRKMIIEGKDIKEVLNEQRFITEMRVSPDDSGIAGISRHR